MPELLPFTTACASWLVAVTPSRFLSMVPASLYGRVFAGRLARQSHLARNYDYDPRFFDGRMRYTEWLKPGDQHPVEQRLGCTGRHERRRPCTGTGFRGRKVSGVGFWHPAGGAPRAGDLLHHSGSDGCS
ncbi:MAG: hypothetical protein IPI05_06755 [Flavobacteriales bacterium]|nr:hypothetical protein [Flavobacteriales bacterium]